MLFHDASEFLEHVRAHNRETGHEIISANDPIARHMGYSCAECPADANSLWEIGILHLRATLPPDLPFQINSQELLDHLNENTRDRFFEDRGSPVDIIPVETIEPNARGLEWAVQHMNMPVQPSEHRGRPGVEDDGGLLPRLPPGDR